MKEKFVSEIMKKAAKKGNYNNLILLKIKYGLEGIYLLLTKLIVIITISIILNTLKHTLLLILFFSVLRAFGFGLHAKKSWICWIESILMYNIIPLFLTNISINPYIKAITCSICIISILICCPADTSKRPIVSFKRRILFKILITIISITYSFFINKYDNYITNIMFYALIYETIMTNYLIYKVFGHSFNNYKRYLES